MSLTSPAAGVVGTAPASVTVSSNASDSDGTIASVAFFANGAPIGTDTSSPYSISWTGVAAGTYSLTAVATDNLGATTTSNAVSVTVNPLVVQGAQNLLTTQVPDSQNVNDGTPYELGFRLVSDVTGQITGLRFWKGTTEIRACTWGICGRRRGSCWPPRRLRTRRVRAGRRRRWGRLSQLQRIPSTSSV